MINRLLMQAFFYHLFNRLSGIPPEPPWMQDAWKLLGMHEVRDKAKVSEWLASDGETLGDPSKLPWCGDFVQTAIKRTLPAEAIPANPYLARNWQKFGLTICPPTYGCVMVFWRKSIDSIYGHVGFYVTEDSEAYHILGGNQSNKVSIARLAKHRLLASRWPHRYPHNTKPRRSEVANSELSRNEA